MSRKRKSGKKNRTGLYIVMLVVGIFLTTLVVQGVSLRNNCQKLATEQSELKEKKKSLKQEKEKIKEQEEYSKTDEYVEDIAREKFGLVYDNEIIFKPEE
jgi:cell division protein DivIC